MSSQNVTYLSQQIINSSIDFQKRFNFSHPHLLKTVNPKLPNFLYFEYSSMTLSKLISQRLPNRLFIETDLLALLRGISSALAYLQLNGISHGNIHPSRIFFDEQTGVFKIYDEELLFGENCSFRNAKLGKSVFLPPELILFYRNPKVTDIRGNCYKGDVFALGLSALEAACLRKSEEIYESGSLTINTGKIEDRLIFMMKHYSRELVHVIRMMVEVDEDIRPDACELYSILGGTKTNLIEVTNNNKENIQECEIDLKKSWDSFDSLHKNYGLQRVKKEESLRKSLCFGEKKKENLENKYLVYQGKNVNKKHLSNSCILNRSEDIDEKSLLKENKKVLQEIPLSYNYN